MMTTASLLWINRRSLKHKSRFECVLRAFLLAGTGIDPLKRCWPDRSERRWLPVMLVVGPRCSIRWPTVIHNSFLDQYGECGEREREGKKRCQSIAASATAKWIEQKTIHYLLRYRNGWEYTAAAAAVHYNNKCASFMPLCLAIHSFSYRMMMKLVHPKIPTL